jgi:hypothetical protein
MASSVAHAAHRAWARARAPSQHSAARSRVRHSTANPQNVPRGRCGRSRRGMHSTRNPLQCRRHWHDFSIHRSAAADVFAGCEFCGLRSTPGSARVAPFFGASSFQHQESRDSLPQPPETASPSRPKQPVHASHLASNALQSPRQATTTVETASELACADPRCWNQERLLHAVGCLSAHHRMSIECPSGTCPGAASIVPCHDRSLTRQLRYHVLPPPWPVLRHQWRYRQSQLQISASRVRRHYGCSRGDSTHMVRVRASRNYLDVVHQCRATKQPHIPQTPSWALFQLRYAH